ncbi:MAG: regulatory protein RecX [Actinobacteria bacterium]|nr:regulatory protein RecX [Actinomycetota bacterium]
MPRQARREPKNPRSCHERALGLLAVRPRSRRELESRLLRAGFEPEEVQDVLGRLERVGLVDDEDFARQVAEHAFGVRREGRRAVASRLAARGISGATAAAILADEPGDEEDRALDLARSRAGRMSGVDDAKAFARLSSLLQRRGYGPEVARRAARRALELELDEQELVRPLVRGTRRPYHRPPREVQPEPQPFDKRRHVSEPIRSRPTGRPTERGTPERAP